jgi:hypothetical protein
MGMRLVWAWLGGVVTGCLLLAFVVYPPAAQWGSSEKWGDIPTWFGAIATFLAVVVALFLPTFQESRRRTERVSVAARLYYDEAERLLTVTLGMNAKMDSAVKSRDKDAVMRLAEEAIFQSLTALDSLATPAGEFPAREASTIAETISAMRSIDRRFAILRRWDDTKARYPDMVGDPFTIGAHAAIELDTAARAVGAAADILKAHGGASIVERGLG